MDEVVLKDKREFSSFTVCTKVSFESLVVINVFSTDDTVAEGSLWEIFFLKAYNDRRHDESFKFCNQILLLFENFRFFFFFRKKAVKLTFSILSVIVCSC